MLGVGADPSDSGLSHWEGEPVHVWARLWGIPSFEAYSALSSTNDRAIELAGTELAAFQAVTAEAQTSGRGRGGKAWDSPPGIGLWISVLLPLSCAENGLPPPATPLRVGLAAAEAIENTVPSVRVDIKWPNDLLIDERKVGGVLCEAGRGSGVVAGIGINVLEPEGGFPLALTGKAISLEAAAGQPPRRALLAGHLLASLRSRFSSAGQRLSSQELEHFESRDFLRGKEISAAAGITGRAVGITPDGSLRVQTGPGVEHVVMSGSIGIS